jgi:methyltransferase (TIGR00027 family)
MATYIGVRSRFFDEFLTGASAAGVDQIVLLAAGLDTRAFLLGWRPGTTVYELDVPQVLQFKDRVLTEQGARARCHRRTVAIDLRDDWPAALQQAGFHPQRPTAWLAEGLLAYLADQTKDSLFARVDKLSPAGSQIAVEYFGGDIATLLNDPTSQAMANQFGIDFARLLPRNQHYDPAQWLADHRWAVSTTPAVTIAQHYQRPLDERILPRMQASLLITAQAERQPVSCDCPTSPSPAWSRFCGYCR